MWTSQEEIFYQRNLFIVLLPEFQSTMIPVISSTCAQCLGKYSARTVTSREFKGHQGRERPTQNTKWQERCTNDWRPAVPSLVDHSLGSFYGLFKPGMQTKQSSLDFDHDILRGQRVGKTNAKTANCSNQSLPATSLLLTSELNPPLFSSQTESSATWGLSLPMQRRQHSRNEIETFSQGQARTKEFSVALGQISPDNQGKRVHLKKPQRSGLPQNVSTCHDENLVPPKVRDQLPPGGEMSWEHRAAGFSLRNPAISTYTKAEEGAFLDCSSDSILDWEMFQWTVLRFIYWTRPRHICARASLTRAALRLSAFS